MYSTDNFVLFLISSLILIVVPGPAVLYIVGRSLQGGRKAGIVSALGVAVAALIHIVFAVFGLSALLMQSALLFQFIKYLGAAYLVYMGIMTLFTRKWKKTEEQREQPLSKAFTQGIIVNLLNPKLALFFFAYLPQFIDPKGMDVKLQIGFLGLVFVFIALISDSIYASLAGSLQELMGKKNLVQKVQKYFSGFIYLGLGVFTALNDGDLDSSVSEN